MSFRLSARSLQRLEGVHPDLVDVVKLVITVTPIDFVVLEGVRSLERQKTLLAQGATTTLNSRHLTGHAVDLAPWVDGEVSWHWPHYHTLAPAVKAAADDLHVPLEWGGDWTSFKDGPHWQLPWDRYPKGRSVRLARQEPAPAPQPAAADPVTAIRDMPLLDAPAALEALAAKLRRHLV